MTPRHSISLHNIRILHNVIDHLEITLGLFWIVWKDVVQYYCTMLLIRRLLCAHFELLSEISRDIIAQYHQSSGGGLLKNLTSRAVRKMTMTKGAGDDTVTGTSNANAAVSKRSRIYSRELHWSSWEMSKGAACANPRDETRRIAREGTEAAPEGGKRGDNCIFMERRDLAPVTFTIADPRVIALGDPSIPRCVAIDPPAISSILSRDRMGRRQRRRRAIARNQEAIAWKYFPTVVIVLFIGYGRVRWNHPLRSL